LIIEKTAKTKCGDYFLDAHIIMLRSISFVFYFNAQSISAMARANRAAVPILT